MLKKIRYKKAGEKLFSIWWFFVLAIVAGGIVIGVYLYYGADVDIREVEANILSKKIVSCIIHNGFLEEDVLKENFNIYKKCGINEDSLSESYFFKIRIFDNKENILKDISGGNPSFDKDCQILENVKGENYPRCINKKENFLYFEEEIKNGFLEVLTASNNYGKEVLVKE